MEELTPRFKRYLEKDVHHYLVNEDGNIVYMDPFFYHQMCVEYGEENVKVEIQRQKKNLQDEV